MIETHAAEKNLVVNDCTYKVLLLACAANYILGTSTPSIALAQRTFQDNACAARREPIHSRKLGISHDRTFVRASCYVRCTPKTVFQAQILAFQKLTEKVIRIHPCVRYWETLCTLNQ